MKDGFAPLKDMPQFEAAFAWFEADSYWGVMKCVAVGCALTLLVQSSSATLGITIGLAVTGVIPYTTAAALVLGENIGTTITVILAQIGATTQAKRAAWAHVLFNVIGVFWITFIFQWYVRLVAAAIERLHGHDPLTITLANAPDEATFGVVVTAGIALVHTGFNLANTALFLPFLRPFTRLLVRVVPDPRVKEVARLKHVDPRTVSAPVLGIEQSRGEVVQMGRSVVEMIDAIRQLGFHGPQDERLIQQTFHREEVLDNVHQEVVKFLTELMDETVPHAVAAEGRRQLRMAHECESASDRMASVLKAYLRLRDHRLELPADLKASLLDLHDGVASLLSRVLAAYEERRPFDDADAQSGNAEILSKVKRLRDLVLQRMTDQPVNPALSLGLAGILTDYSRIRAHAMNLHEAAAEPASDSVL
jgi:phosphate:Na+ symporter